MLPTNPPTPPFPSTLVLSTFCLSSILLRPLQLQHEKAELEQHLEQEQEFQVNKLMKKIKKMENETISKQLTLEQVHPAGLLWDAKRRQETQCMSFPQRDLDTPVVCGLVRHVWASPYFSFSCSVGKMRLWLIHPLLVVSPHDHSDVRFNRIPHTPNLCPS